MPKISVIIPVYNASLYLSRCVDSLIDAIIPDSSVEIILINDGSTDNSLAICNEYANKYNFIKVFDQRNQGPSAARNLGIQNASGEWISFVDSDDYVEIDYYKVIFDNQKSDLDILIFGYTKVINQSKIQNPFPVGEFDKMKIEKLLKKSSDNMKLFWFPVTKVYRRDVIGNILFKEEIKIGEDTIFNLEVFSKANSIKIIENCLYNYVHNEDSLTQIKYKPDLLQNMIAHYLARKEIQKNKEFISKEFNNDIAQYYINHILFWLLQNIKNHPQKQKKMSDLIKARNSIIYKETFSNYFYDWKHPKKSMIIKFFELRWFNLLLRLI